MKILTFYAPKEKDYEKVVGDSVTNQEDYESLPDLIARICRGEVRPSTGYGYTLSGDDDSDEAFDSCDDVDDVDIVPSVILDESGFGTAVAVERSQSKTSANEASVSAPVDEERVAPSQKDERSTAEAVQADKAG